MAEQKPPELDHEFLAFAQNAIPYDISKITHGDLSEMDYQPAVRNVQAGAKGVAKFFQHRKDLSLDAERCIDIAFNWLDKHFGYLMRGSIVLSLETTLSVASLDKSPGSLWRQYWKTKSEMIQSLKGKNIIEQYWDSLATTHAEEVFFAAHMKEELRVKSKVLSFSTRVFIAAPSEHTLAGVRLFHDQNKKIMSSALSHFSAVGMNKYQLGWHKLYMKIDAFKNKESIDVKNFDGSIYACMLWKVAAFRCSMLCREHNTIENQLRIYNYYWALINSIIILPDGNAVYKTDGMPSGVYVTSIDDTFINFVYLVFGYIYNGGLPDYDFFMNNIVAALYGDDNAYSYSDQIAEFVNGKLYASTLHEVFGLTVTGFGLKSWDEMSFLSHDFQLRDGTMIPALSQNRIICSQIVGSCDPLMSAQRASAFRILSWPHLKLFYLFTDYLLHLMRTFDYIPKTLLNTDRDIEELYLNYEFMASRLSFTKTINKIIEYNKHYQ
jgi:hypothetical protein